MKAMILAAGLGTRLRPLTNTVPKPAIPLLGVPLGFWSLFHLLEAGCDKLVVNTHYLPEKIKSLYELIRPQVQALSFSDERDKILGSGGAVWLAKKLLLNEPIQKVSPLSRLFKTLIGTNTENFWLVNGDEVFLPESENVFTQAYSHHKKSKNIATLLVIENPEVGAKFGGVWCDKTNSVKGFGKSSPIVGLKGWHYIGFMILNEKIFEYLPEGESNILYDAVTTSIQNGEKVEALPVSGIWFETGNVEDLKHATESLHLLKGKHQTLDRILSKFCFNTSA